MHGKIWKLRFFYVLGKWMYRCWLMDACFRKDVFLFLWHSFQTRSPVPKHPIAKSQIDVWKSMFIDGKHMHRWRSGVVCTWKMYFWFEKGSPSGSKNHLYTREKNKLQGSAEAESGAQVALKRWRRCRWSKALVWAKTLQMRMMWWCMEQRTKGNAPKENFCKPVIL